MSLVKIEEIISERGKNILDKIFGSNITVIEKISGASFYMKNTNEGKCFYRQSENTPINLVDRTLNKLWNDPLCYLEQFDSMTIPEDWTFKFEWFYSDAPQGMKYSRKPKNGLVMTGIWDQKGNLVTELETYENYNNYFQIESVPLLWEGTLSEDQKELIQKFIQTPNEVSKTSFIRYFLNILNPKIKGCLQDNVSDPIEGVIVKFNDQEVEDLILIDQIFEDITKNIKVNRSREPKTIYSVILVDILHWINENAPINLITIKGDNADQKYLNLIVDLWKLFVNENGERYIGLDFQLPSELKEESFRLNTSYINDPVALKMLDENEEYENLLQIFLAGFKKKKKRPIGLLTEDLLNDFNLIIDKIKTKIFAVYESRMPSYKEFKMMQSLNESEEDELIDDEIRDETVNIDQNVGVQEEPAIEEAPPIVPEIPEPVTSFINPIIVEFRKISDVIICFNQDIPTKELLNLISNVVVEFDKKVILFSPGNNKMKEIILQKFVTNYSSLIKELITNELTWEVLLKKYPTSDIYVDVSEFEWSTLVITSLNNKTLIHSEGIYNSGIESSITENDFVKFKESVPETVEEDWLTIISLKNEVPQ